MDVTRTKRSCLSPSVPSTLTSCYSRIFILHVKTPLENLISWSHLSSHSSIHQFIGNYFKYLRLKSLNINFKPTEKNRFVKKTWNLVGSKNVFCIIKRNYYIHKVRSCDSQHLSVNIMTVKSILMKSSGNVNKGPGNRWFLYILATFSILDGLWPLIFQI